MSRSRRSSDQWARTSINRLAPGFASVYWVMFPFDTHGVTKKRGNDVSETSMTGSMFGWETYLPPSTSRRRVLHGMH